MYYCKTFVSVANKGSYDLEAHINTAKHKKQNQSCHSTPNISEPFIKQHSKTEERVIATEAARSFHAVKHHLSHRPMECISKLNQFIYSNSEIPKNVTCARTKTTVNNMIALYLVAMAIRDLNEVSCLGVSTDGSNHSSLKYIERPWPP
jgi:glycyl-tRNA synthetase (class II)